MACKVIGFTYHLVGEWKSGHMTLTTPVFKITITFSALMPPEPTSATFPAVPSAPAATFRCQCHSTFFLFVTIAQRQEARLAFQALVWVEGNQPIHMDVCFFASDGTMQMDIRMENTYVREVGFHPPTESALVYS
jgi:hypothetical protein